MKARRILHAIGWVDDKYILEMEGKPAKAVRTKRIWLIAAVIATLLLLAGCVAIYLSLQDFAIGQETITQKTDRRGYPIDPIEKTYDIVSLTGYANAPDQKAIAEWLSYLQSYDPEGKFLTNEPNLPEIPDAEEMVYGCYTTEMVNKLHEIADKYDLKLLDAYTGIQDYQMQYALEALGTSSLLKENAPASMGRCGGPLVPPYDFKFEYYLTMTGDALWKEEFIVTESYHRNGYFPKNSYWMLSLEDFQQWNYTTKDGTRLLLALSNQGRAIIVADMKEGFLSISFDTYSGTAELPNATAYISKEGLEEIAEVFEYHIPKGEIDISAIQDDLISAEKEYQEKNPPYRPKTYTDFDNYIENCGQWMGPEEYSYCFFDYNGDGVEELLIGYKGKVNRIVVLNGNETEEQFYAGATFCQGGVRHFIDDISIPGVNTLILHKYFDSNRLLFVLYQKDGIWYQSPDTVDSPEKLPAISEAEAQQIMAQYPPIEFQWQSMMDYVFADGSTLAERLYK